MRRRFLRNPAAPDILQQLERLSEIGVETHAQLVIVPGFNDGPWLQKSIDDLSHLWPAVRSISVVPVGLTKHHRYGMRVHTAAEASTMIEILEPLQKRYDEAIDVGFVYLTDEWYLTSGSEVPPLEAYDELQLQENGLGMVRDFLDEWQALKSEIKAWQRKKTGNNQQRQDLQYDSITLVTGRLFANQLQKTGNEFSKLTGTQIEVIPIENIRLGKTITVAGLLMVEDILDQLIQYDLAQLILLPRIVFDHPDLISLDDRTPQEIANRLGRPVALVDQMGDVWDALTGRSKTLFQPDNT
jgi:NifB/MoaA-like Fe-S oxidoreductase